MPRGMDERFDDPSEEAENEEAATDKETMDATPEAEGPDSRPTTASEE